MGIFDLISIIPNAFRTVDNITAAIANEKINARNAQSEDEKTRANERIKALEARRDVMIAEAPTARTNLIVRAVAAAPAVAVAWKLLVWDKVLGSLVGCSQAPKGTCGIFTTDPLDDNQWKIIAVVYGFYFLYEISLGLKR